MNAVKGLESIHRWKKEHKEEMKNMKDIEKKIKSLSERASSDEVHIYEKKLYASQEKISILEKKMIESWKG